VVPAPDFRARDRFGWGRSVGEGCGPDRGGQRVEHYEIAGYGTASTLADQLGLDDARDVLDQTLDEESNADKLLTKIATGGMFRTGINEQAAR
jgi:ferritin-like metal-binding protein YciE